MFVGTGMGVAVCGMLVGGGASVGVAGGAGGFVGEVSIGVKVFVGLGTEVDVGIGRTGVEVGRGGRFGSVGGL